MGPITLSLALAVALGSAADAAGARAAAAGLKSPDVTKRRAAAGELARMGQRARAAVPDLVAALKDKDLGVRTNATNALADVGGLTPAVVPALLESLHKEAEFVRNLALRPLRQVGEGAFPALAEASRRDDAGVAAFASALLDRLRAEAAQELAAARRAITRAQEKMARPNEKAAGKEAVVRLATALRHPDLEVRRAALEQVREVPHDDAYVPGMVAAIHPDGEPKFLERAVRTVTHTSLDHVTILAAALREPDVKLRRQAAGLLANTRWGAARAVPVLRDALKDADEQVVRAAVGSLERIGVDEARAAVPDLLALRRDPKRAGLHAAIDKALREIDEDALKKLKPD